LAYATTVEFDWDEGKRRANLAKYGLDFTRAAVLFAGAVLRTEDARRDHAERRVIAVGAAAGQVLTCVYTDRIAADGRLLRRIISLRPASREERAAYADHAHPPA
jgi:uncharacterized protein